MTDLLVTEFTGCSTRGQSEQLQNKVNLFYFVILNGGDYTKVFLQGAFYAPISVVLPRWCVQRTLHSLSDKVELDTGAISTWIALFSWIATYVSVSMTRAFHKFDIVDFCLTSSSAIPYLIHQIAEFCIVFVAQGKPVI